MKRFIWGFLILMVSCAFGIALPLNDRIENLKNQRQEVQQKIEAQARIFEMLIDRKEMPLKGFAQSFAKFQYLLKRESLTYGFRTQLQVNGKPQEISMDYEGISQVNFKLTFFNATTDDEIVRIFSHVEKLEGLVPVDIKSMTYKDNMVEIIGGVYGT